MKHWLDTVFEDTGWIPREQIRGAETEFYANENFLVQNEQEANPPTLILVLFELFRRAKEEGNTEFLAEIAKLWPKAKKWFDWFHKSQRSSGYTFGPLSGIIKEEGAFFFVFFNFEKI